MEEGMLKELLALSRKFLRDGKPYWFYWRHGNERQEGGFDYVSTRVVAQRLSVVVVGYRSTSTDKEQLCLAPKPLNEVIQL